MSRPKPTILAEITNKDTYKTDQILASDGIWAVYYREGPINIKTLNLFNEELMLPYKMICNKIIDNMTKINDLKFLKFRDILYDIFIYNLDITDCIWYILSTHIKENRIKNEHLSDVLIKTYSFFQYYNNNYRPIYHLEKYLFYLIKIIHNY